MRGRTFAVKIRGSDAGVRVLSAIAKGAGQRGAAAFVVMRILTVVNRTVDRYGPHRGRVSIAIAVIVLAAVTGCPNIDVAQAISSL